MNQTPDVEKVARFEAALNQLIERIAEDRYVLAIVLAGSLSAETIWQRDSLGVWIIEILRFSTFLRNCARFLSAT